DPVGRDAQRGHAGFLRHHPVSDPQPQRPAPVRPGAGAAGGQRYGTGLVSIDEYDEILGPAERAVDAGLVGPSQGVQDRGVVGRAGHRAGDRPAVTPFDLGHRGPFGLGGQVHAHGQHPPHASGGRGRRSGGPSPAAALRSLVGYPLPPSVTSPKTVWSNSLPLTVSLSTTSICQVPAAGSVVASSASPVTWPLTVCGVVALATTVPLGLTR